MGYWKLHYINLIAFDNQENASRFQSPAGIDRDDDFRVWNTWPRSHTTSLDNVQPSRNHPRRENTDRTHLPGLWLVLVCCLLIRWPLPRVDCEQSLSYCVRGTRTHPNFVLISVYRQEILRFVVWKLQIGRASRFFRGSFSCSYATS